MLHSSRNIITNIKPQLNNLRSTQLSSLASKASVHAPSALNPYAQSFSTSTSMAQATSPPKTLTGMSFADALNHRRSVYSLTDKLPSDLTDKVITGILKDTVLHTPSAFNSQTSRIVLLVKDQHKKFWQQVIDVLKPTYDPEKWQSSEKRFRGFEAAYGSVLFFEDTKTIKKYADSTPAYADLFPGWSDHTTGMHQLVVWTALEAFEGVGANLQHYHYKPEVEKQAKKTWGLPIEWEMKAQLVFGGVAEGGFPKEGKEKLSTEETVKVFGA